MQIGGDEDCVQEILKLNGIADPRTIQRALNLILIARNLERLGDHATNIAEDVIYAISGRDVRHGGLADKDGGGLADKDGGGLADKDGGGPADKESREPS